jgi:hypothetical protein
MQKPFLTFAGPCRIVAFVKIFTISSVALSGLFLWLPLHAQILDTFGTPMATDALNYNVVAEFGSAATFAINGSDQFQPTSNANETTAFYWKSGAVLSDTIFGESVSIDIDEIYTQAAAGLGLATSTGGANYKELSIYNVSGNGSGTAGITGISLSGLTLNFALGAITETITRNSGTGFTLKLAGPGLTSGGGTYSTTFTDSSFAGLNVDFGLDVYNSATPASHGHQIEDNLTFVVPEPSTYALILGSLGACAFVGRIRRSSQSL